MKLLKKGWWRSAVIILLGSAAAAQAAKLVLKDGTELDGTGIGQADGYWVKTPDGVSHVVASSDVASIDWNAGAPAPMRGPSGAAVGADSFYVTQARAESCIFAFQAALLWQHFVDAHPNDPNIAAARGELGRWTAMGDVVKIHGRWVGGDELKQYAEQFTKLLNDAVSLYDARDYAEAEAKLQQAHDIFAQSAILNYAMGRVELARRRYFDALRYFRENEDLRPGSADTYCNIGVALAMTGEYAQAIQALRKAADIAPSLAIATDLEIAVAAAPADVQNNPNLRASIKESGVLTAKYHLDPTQRSFKLMLPPETHLVPDGTPLWVGSGFVISARGLILTNRHVAEGDHHLKVTLGGQDYDAQVVVIDTVQDLAVLSIMPRRPLSPLKLADATPPLGADCTVLGFPMIDKIGNNLKVTRGIVSGIQDVPLADPEVLLDAKVNPGNSGGPILDSHGNVVAVVCEKTRLGGEDDYGIGISAGHVRQFLQSHHISVDPAPAETGTDLSTEQVVSQAQPAVVMIEAVE